MKDQIFTNDELQVIGKFFTVMIRAAVKECASARGLEERAAGQGSQFSVDMALCLGTLFCTVAGYFAVQPMLAAARAGQGAVTSAPECSRSAPSSSTTSTRGCTAVSSPLA